MSVSKKRWLSILSVVCILSPLFAVLVLDGVASAQGGIGVITNSYTGSCQVVLTQGGLVGATVSTGTELGSIYYQVSCSSMSLLSGTTVLVMETRAVDGNSYEFGITYCGTDPASLNCGTGIPSDMSNWSVSDVQYLDELGMDTCSIGGTDTGCVSPPIEDNQGGYWEAGYVQGYTGLQACDGVGSPYNMNYVFDELCSSSLPLGSSGDPFSGHADTIMGTATVTGGGGGGSSGGSGGSTEYCGLNGITGDNSAPTGDGTTDYTYVAGFAGDADAVVFTDTSITSGTTVSYFGGQTQIGTVPTFYKAGTWGDVQNGGGVFSPVEQTIVWPSGDVVNPTVWCHYTDGGTLASPTGVGHWVDWGAVDSLNYGGISCGSSLDDPNCPTVSTTTACLDGTGLSLSPSSWVPGLLKGAGCILKWAFVPSGSQLSFMHDTLIVPIDHTIPFSYVAGGLTDVHAFVTAADSATNNCDAPQIGFTNPSSGFFQRVNVSQFQVTLPDPPSCGGTYALSGEGSVSNADYVGNLFGYRTLIRDLLAFGVWLTFVAIAWGMMPWSRVNDGISVITSGGGLLGGISGAINGVVDAPKTDDGEDNGYDGSGAGRDGL